MNITALFKKGEKKCAGNYRSVSLTSVVCKVLESVIRENIVEHEIFSDKQFGFISGRTTGLQLIRVIDNWTEILDEGGCVDVAYCDFMNTFDKVCHKRLVHKLESLSEKTYCHIGKCTVSSNKVSTRIIKPHVRGAAT